MASVTALLLLFVHFLTFGAQVLAVVVFWQTGNIRCFTACATTLIFTGCFFADAVWRGALWRPCGVLVLPIKQLPCWAKGLCCCPLVLGCGCLQGVMVPLTLEQIRTGAGAAAQSSGGGGQSMTSFHAKAVNGLFEGIICSATLLYAYLGTGFPAHHHITYDPPSWPLKWLGMQDILRVVGLVSFASGGLGILHLDHCVCMKLGAYIRSGRNPFFRLFKHWLFRTCELISRVSLHVLYILVTVEFTPCLRWVPLLTSMLFSVAMMYILAGSEVSRLVIWLCGSVCTFVDVFRFVDSPYKRKAARRISLVVAWRHAVELVYMPVLMVLIIGQNKPGPDHGLTAGARQLADDIVGFARRHPVVMGCIGVSLPFYLFTMIFGTGLRRFRGGEEADDIFEACEQLNLEEVRRLALGGVRADVNCQDSEGRTPLASVLLGRRVHDERSAAICGILLEGGAKIDAKAPTERVWLRRMFRHEAYFRWTPLHLAAWRASTEVLRELLRWVPPDVPADELLQVFQDRVGSTPLHVAVAYGRPEAAKCLAGRFPTWCDAPNHKGKTPWDLARTEALKQALRSPALAVEPDDSPTRERALSSPWSWEEHRVNRNVLYRAPGLCSYVVGSAGGPACGSVLRLIPEAQLLQDSLPVDSQQQLQRRQSNTRGNSFAAAAPPSMKAEDLEPLDKRSRQPCQDWVRKFHRKEQPDVEELISTIKQKGFCKDSVLGKGAYGVVWLARRRGGEDGELFAVKNISGLGDVTRRERDMSDAVRISPHPNLVRLFGVQDFVNQEFCSLIMEFIPGGELQKAIEDAREASRQRGQPYAAPVDTIPWLGQVFLALEHLHIVMKVLLRDLKPDNVVLDERRRAKLIDLGLGRMGTQSAGQFTLTGQPPGTPGYCAPEVLRQEAYNERADIYSFGVTAWVLLTGGLRSKAGPPTGFDGTIPGCFADGELLQECINEPNEHDALPIGHADAYAFVTSLVALLPDQRPDHAAIRSHTFFTDHIRPPLPERQEGRRGVERWLAEMGY